MFSDQRTTRLAHYLVLLYESRFIREKRACMHSPIASLNYSDLRVFQVLDLKGPTNMGSLSEETAIPMSTLSGIVDKLVKLGFLQRARSVQDRRVVEVLISSDGREAFGYRKAAHESLSRDVLATLDPPEQDEFLRLLGKILGD